MIANRKNAVSLTARGFAVYGEITNTRGNILRVQESSSAQVNACYLFCRNSEGDGAIGHLGQPCAVIPHLDRAGVIALRDALDRFLADEEEAEPPEFG